MKKCVSTAAVGSKKTFNFVLQETRLLLGLLFYLGLEGMVTLPDTVQSIVLPKLLKVNNTVLENFVVYDCKLSQKNDVLWDARIFRPVWPLA